MENIYPPPFSVNHGQCLAAMQSALRQEEESLLALRHCLHAFPSRDNVEFSLWVKTTPVWGVSPIADVLTSLCPAKFVFSTPLVPYLLKRICVTNVNNKRIDTWRSFYALTVMLGG